jgi:hypothetical protein
MNPERYVPVARAITLTVVILALVALSWWYLYIGRQQSSIDEVAAGRGFGSAIPTFEAPGGSTFNNLLGSLPAVSSGNEKKRPRLSQVHAAPVAGFRLSSTSIQYMDRSGYLYTADLEYERVARTTNTLIPRVYKALLGSDAMFGFAFDEGGEAEAFVGVMGKATSTGVLPGIQTRSLGNSVRAAAATDGGLLTLVENPGGGTSLVASRFDSTSPELILRSAISAWNIETAGERIALVEKSGTGLPASAYEIVDKELTLLVKDAPGLTLRLREGSGALLFGTDTGVLSLSVRTDEERPVSLKTIAEKCVWAPEDTENPLAYCAVPVEIPSERFLDDWYRGAVRTRDSWWRIDASDASVKEVYSPPDIALGLDVANPQVDPSGEHIVFQNKYDESLWVLRTRE